MSIIGAHALFYTSEPEALRAMLRDVFGFDHVDAGGGWLIFRLPPAELGVHPAEGPSYKSGGRHQLAFMCDDIHATIRDLRAKGVDVKGDPVEESYGVTVMLGLPGGVEAMLYEPRHVMAIEPPHSSSQPALVVLLNEVLNGPSSEAAYLLNRGDRGLLASLDALSADQASARPGGRSSVAAHVEHVRYGLGLFNRWARGEDPWRDADFAASWSRQEVTEKQWRELRDALAREARAWLEAVKRPRTWDDTAATDALGSVAHLAYHLGAIRQLASAAAGPRAAGVGSSSSG
jgi:catechol 2,3-dioxygenase-like lactoylglutathione lyase family enzyme